MAQFFIGRQDRDVVEVIYNNNRSSLTCQITDWWKNLDTTSSACGCEVKYKVEKRIGLSETDMHSLEGSVESSLGIPKVLELKSKISESTQTEIKWETDIAESKTYSFIPPECGRQTNAVYQLVREYAFVNKHHKLFGRTDSWSIVINEYLPFFDVRPNREPWSAECKCKGEEEANFDGTFNLDLGNASLQVCYRVVSDGVDLDFDGTHVQLELDTPQRVQLTIPTNILPEVVLWLGNIRSDTVKGELVPYTQPVIQMSAREAQEFGEVIDRIYLAEEQTTAQPIIQEGQP